MMCAVQPLKVGACLMCFLTGKSSNSTTVKPKKDPEAESEGVLDVVNNIIYHCVLLALYRAPQD